MASSRTPSHLTSLKPISNHGQLSSKNLFFELGTCKKGKFSSYQQNSVKSISDCHFFGSKKLIFGLGTCKKGKLSTYQRNSLKPVSDCDFFSSKKLILGLGACKKGKLSSYRQNSLKPVSDCDNFSSKKLIFGLGDCKKEKLSSYRQNSLIPVSDYHFFGSKKLIFWLDTCKKRKLSSYWQNSSKPISDCDFLFSKKLIFGLGTCKKRKLRSYRQNSLKPISDCDFFSSKKLICGLGNCKKGKLSSYRISSFQYISVGGLCSSKKMNFELATCEKWKLSSFELSSLKPISVCCLIRSRRLNFELGFHKKRRFFRKMAKPEQTEMSEMIKAPDSETDDGSGREINDRSRKSEAIVFKNGSFKFDLDFSSQGLESTLNKLSKWIVAGLFVIAILWKHDAEAMWTAMGSVINALLSNQLKKILNHQRPDPSLRSGPGMPSSHSQSIFYAASYVVISLIDSWGVNLYTISLVAFTLACAVYLSWLRVSQRLHTIAQVSVGATIGTAFCVGWFYFWHELVLEAFLSSLWLRVSLVLASIGSCIGFVVYVFQTWLVDKEEDSL